MSGIKTVKTIAIVGYSNSGKSTTAAAIIAEATRRGMRVAAIKVGHAETPDDTPMRDSDRFAAAGADPVVFRTPEGWTLEIRDDLEARTDPLRIPEWLTRAIAEVDLLVVEGRRVDGAPLVQTVGADGAHKILPEECDLVIEDVPGCPLPAQLLAMIAD